MRKSNFINKGFILTALLSYALWLIFPMVWVAYSSFKKDSDIFNNTFSIPSLTDLHFENYSNAWRQAHFGDYFQNSIIITFCTVSLILIMGSAAAYVLSRFYHPFRNFIFWLFLAGLMIPIQLSVIPLFFELKTLGLLNSKLGLIFVYTANGLPFAIFILTGFFRSLPRSLYEAAVIDGCGEFEAFYKIMLPLARPGLITVSIFQFIGVWKEYFYAFMFLGGDRQATSKTLPLGLANISITAQYRSDYGALFAGLVLVTLPILLIYIFLQKRIVKGIAAGALKG